MLALGIPDKYAMQRTGHATTYTLKKVYQKIMADREEQADQEIADRMRELSGNPKQQRSKILAFCLAFGGNVLISQGRIMILLSTEQD